MRLLIVLLFAASCTSSPQHVTLDGEWTLPINLGTAGQDQTSTFDYLVVTGPQGQLTGNGTIADTICAVTRHSMTMTGTLVGNQVAMTFTDDQHFQFTFTGTLSADGQTIHGTVDGNVTCTDLMSAAATAQRTATPQPGSDSGGGSGSGAACTSPASCGGATPFCCADIVTSDTMCTTASDSATCTASCTTSSSSSCPGHATERVCATSSDCNGDATYVNCCSTSGVFPFSVCVDDATKATLIQHGVTCS